MELRFHLQLTNPKKKKTAKIEKVYQGNILLTLFFVFFEVLRLVWDELKNETVFEFPEIPKHIKKKLNKKVRLEKKHYRVAFLILLIFILSIYLSDNPYILALGNNGLEEKNNASFLHIKLAQAEDNAPENSLPDSEKPGNVVSGVQLCSKDKSEKRSSNNCGIDQTEEGIDKITIEPKPVPVKNNPIVKKISYSRGIRCANPGEKPRKSKQGKGKHTDEDCCPDPDEYPMPGCAYSAADLAIMLKR